jgi:hypothetical protein
MEVWRGVHLVPPDLAPRRPGLQKFGVSLLRSGRRQVLPTQSPGFQTTGRAMWSSGSRRSLKDGRFASPAHSAFEVRNGRQRWRATTCVASLGPPL